MGDGQAELLLHKFCVRGERNGGKAFISYAGILVGIRFARADADMHDKKLQLRSFVCSLSRRRLFFANSHCPRHTSGVENNIPAIIGCTTTC